VLLERPNEINIFLILIYAPYRKNMLAVILVSN
jgi:hypothetical protein